MDNIKEQLNDYLTGEDLIGELTVLPPVREVNSIDERLTALLDIYKIYIPNKCTADIYNRLRLALLNSLEKKNTLYEVQMQNDNFRAIKGLKRYGVIGGLESFSITGTAGLGKTSSVRRCAEVITGNKILVREDPLRKIIPILFVECVADGSFKSLLYSILQEVDRMLDTSYFASNRRVSVTVDVLLAAVSNVLINHVAVLVIDEIERVANDSKKGITLINYLTQLVNQSNIAICFVGNESANRYFETKEYMSRRTVGISIKKMDYGEYFYNFCRILFSYQYTESKIELSAEYARMLYKLSGGSPSMLVSLYVETQKNAIISGAKCLTVADFENTFGEVFSNMARYIDFDKTKVPTKKRTASVKNTESVSFDMPNLFAYTAERADKDIDRFISLLKEHTGVEYLC